MPTTLFLTTVTPIHIGTGKNLEPFDYAILDNVLHRIDTNAIFHTLYEKHPTAGDKLLQWINGIQESLDKNKDNKEQSRIRNTFTILNYIQSQIKDPTLANIIEQQLKNGDGFAHYSVEFPRLQKRKKELRECVKTATNDVYIPGTSLKGSVRTALLAYAIKKLSPKDIEQISTTLSAKLKNGRFEDIKKNLAQTVEKEIFYCNVDTPDAKYDLMKLIKVSDSTSQPVKENVAVSSVDLYLKSTREKQTQTPLVEAIKPGKIFEVTLSIDMDFLRTVSKLLHDCDETIGKTKWIGIAQKINHLLNIDLQRVHTESQDEVEERILTHILTVVENFFGDVQKNEQQWAEEVAKNMKHQHNKAAEKMLEQYKQFPKGCMKIGYASGFPATTVFFAMKENKNLLNIEKEIFRKLKSEVSQTSGNRIEEDKEINIERFPASRRFETLSETTINPMGWVILSKEPVQISLIQQKVIDAPAVKSSIPKDALKATVVEVLGPKQLKVKLEEGKYQGQENTVGGAQFGNLGIIAGSKVYVSVTEQKGKLQSLKFIAKV